MKVYVTQIQTDPAENEPRFFQETNSKTKKKIGQTSMMLTNYLQFSDIKFPNQSSEVSGQWKRVATSIFS